MRTELPLTGERTVPEVADEAYWFSRHVVAYDLAVQRGAGPRTLDAGCGEGYGADALATAGGDTGVTVGVDLDDESVRHVRRRYPQVHAVRAELGALPFPEGVFDLVVSFQVIEHVWDVPGYVRSLRRVVRPGGEVLISTPNRLTFTPASDVPVNVFHHREFTAAELVAELEAADLDVHTVIGIHHGRLLGLAERLWGRTPGVGRSLQHRLGHSPPGTWPSLLRRTVHRSRPSWFRVSADRLDESLDLIAVCTRPAGSSS